jgi:hypothetical protein
MRTIAKNLLPLFFITMFLAVVFPVWSQESQPEQTPDQPTQTAETEQASTPDASTDEVSTSIDSEISVWTNDVEEDSSKAEEYGEIPEGFLVNYLSARILMKDDRHVDVRARNVGLNNGIYGMDYGVIGKYEVYVDYRKIPHLFSKSGETIWNEDSSGVWALPDSVQGAIQDLNPFPVNSSDPI